MPLLSCIQRQTQPLNINTLAKQAQRQRQLFNLNNDRAGFVSVQSSAEDVCSLINTLTFSLTHCRVEDNRERATKSTAERETS
eukprot:1141623-Pelagomonas_calceolata.AAC.3